MAYAFRRHTDQEMQMTKRPKLSEHIRLPEGVAFAPRPVVPQSGTARAIDLVAAPLRHPAFASDRPAGTDPMEVFGEAYMAMSHAAYLGWREGMTMQFRLASYLLNFKPSPFMPPALIG